MVTPCCVPHESPERMVLVRFLGLEFCPHKKLHFLRSSDDFWTSDFHNRLLLRVWSRRGGKIISSQPNFKLTSNPLYCKLLSWLSSLWRWNDWIREQLCPRWRIHSCNFEVDYNIYCCDLTSKFFLSVLSVFEPEFQLCTTCCWRLWVWSPLVRLRVEGEPLDWAWHSPPD